jgi:hypothetical protein
MAGEDVAPVEERGPAEEGAARDEGEDEGSGEGLGFALPAARMKRIMRKNPDKKKNFSKETVLAVSMATVLFTQPPPPRSTPSGTESFLHPSCSRAHVPRVPAGRHA